MSFFKQNDSGSFMSFMNNLTDFCENTFLWTVALFLIPTVITVMTLKSCAQNAFTRNKVQIVELNYRLWDGEEKCLAEVTSIRKAENWLLKKGYKCRPVYTRMYLPHSDNCGDSYGEYQNSKFKTFATKGEPGSEDESIVMLVVDYGNHDLHLLPFRYKEEESPINFSRFERIGLPLKRHYADTGDGCAPEFELCHYSTHYNQPQFLRYWSGEKWPKGQYSPEKFDEERRVYAADRVRYFADQVRLGRL